MTRVHCFSDDALADLDATGLVAALRAGSVSVPELVEAAIARTEQVDAALGAVAYAAWDRARDEARHPRAGFFSGVPTFVKDNVDVAGMPTQHGSDAFTARPAGQDGDFARMYRSLGLLPLGKTQLSEFGFSGAADHVRLGPVRSPWSPEHYAGASSAGSAALVAAGAVPIAHANDGGGSIRIPAAVNGLVGLKPTRGRLAQDRMMRDMPVRIVSDGVLTRTVRDTAAFYREAEKVWRNPVLAPVGDVTRPSRARLRIAVVTQGIGREPSPEVRELTLATASLLESLGHHVEEIDNPVPASFPEHFVRFWSLLALVITRRGAKDFGPSWDAGRLDNLTLGLARHAARNLHRMPISIAVLRGSARVAARHRASYDITLTPTLATETPLVGHLRPDQDYDEIMGRLMDWVAFTPLQNATGEPAISLPLATTASGLPQGMMLGAGAGREARLLGLAHELEEAIGWPRIQGGEQAG
ncbi:amidase [Nocardioides hwasunensis]|uniref:Amidase n=1 Tax=Nocardioides hwasunensis TaxID=397258 RepID=A0ABR8MGI8_9ACTN|nr:amidase [Nocardioides hwasunensis]MBD3913830.1 amidase [Nocardioides hwasunensis]